MRQSSATHRALLAGALMASLAGLAAFALPAPHPRAHPTSIPRQSTTTSVEQYPLTGSLDRQSRPVSIVELHPDCFAFADYKGLYVVSFVGPDRVCHIVRPNIALPGDYYEDLPNPFTSLESGRSKPRNVNPTGLCY